jgi:hypothetical protein
MQSPGAAEIALWPVIGDTLEATLVAETMGMWDREASRGIVKECENCWNELSGQP